MTDLRTVAVAVAEQIRDVGLATMFADNRVHVQAEGFPCHTR